MKRWLATALRWAANRLDGGEVCRGKVVTNPMHPCEQLGHAPPRPLPPRSHGLARETAGPLGEATTVSALALKDAHIGRARHRRARG